LTSICIAVIPTDVRATLKSISHKKSSCAWISESILYSPLSSSYIIPIATAETGLLIGTHAFIRLIVEPHTDAIELDPLQVVTSDTVRIIYGNSASLGRTGSSALSASRPCPISLRPVPRIILTSHTEYGGKL